MKLCEPTKKKSLNWYDDHIRRWRRSRSKGTGRNAGHRHRADPEMEVAVHDWVQLDPGAHITGPAPGVSFEVGYRTNEMWDTHGYIRNWYNPLTQEKYRGGTGAIPDLAGTFSFGTVRDLSTREAIRGSIPFLWPAQLDELALKSEVELSSVVPENFSVVNFVLEIIQTVTLNLRVIPKFAARWERMIKEYTRELSRLRRQAGLNETRRRWLAWNFAIKPAIADLKALLCSLERAERHLQWLRENNHKVVHLTYTRKDLQEIGLPFNWDPNEYHDGQTLLGVLNANDPSLNGTYVLQVSVVDLKIDYIARSKVRIDLPDELIEGNGALVTLWSAMNGLYNPVDVVWEAIPFSWLIDYFLAYRARLFQVLLDDNPFDRYIDVQGYGHSFRIEARGNSRIYRYGGLGDGVYFEGGGWEYEFYTRSAGLPNGQATYFRVPATWYQFSMMVAVGLGFVKPRRRRKSSGIRP